MCTKKIHSLLLCILFIILCGCSTSSLHTYKKRNIFCYNSNDTLITFEFSKNNTFKIYEKTDKYFVTIGCFGDIEYLDNNELIIKPQRYEFDRIPYTIKRTNFITNDSISIVTRTFLGDSGNCYLQLDSIQLKLNPDGDTIRVCYRPKIKIRIEADIIKEFDGLLYSPITHLSTDTIVFYPSKNELIYIETTPLYYLPLVLNIDQQRIVKDADNFHLTIHGYNFSFKPCYR